MRGKKGIELSVNFIVMLILAIALFGFGLYFASTLFGKSGSITEEAYDKFDKQIEGLACASADKVCVPVTTRDVGGGGYAVVGVVVENVLGKKVDFQVFAEPSTIFIDKAGKEYSLGQDNREKLLVLPTRGKERTITLENREKLSVGIAVQPKGVPSGTYPFNVYVSYMGADGLRSYTEDRPLKFYIVVP